MVDRVPDAAGRRLPRVASLTTQPIGEDWWREGVIYHVYPRSFADSDGDGTGDLRGIAERLDYLGPEGLGVDAIWLSPIYLSPGHDVGYDVSDHGAVDPLMGTEQDFDDLIREAHLRGLRVILDLVLNHTSDEHPWFKASRASRDGPFANHFLWRDPDGRDDEGNPRVPNNWVSLFGGSGWEWEPARGQFYYHTFLREQPELNWREPAVERDQFAMVRRWLDRGVDGFRLDVFNALLKHPELPSNPVLPDGDSAWYRLDHLHDLHHDDLPALVDRFRAILDERPGRMSVGELFARPLDMAAALTADRHLAFDWELLRAPWDAEAFRGAIARREAAFGPARWPSGVLSNHDQSRHATRLLVGADPGERDAIAKAAAVVLLALRGTPFLYYGEELGMGDSQVPPEQSVDPPATRAFPDFTWWDRSQCRAPMPWDDGPGAGFTTGRAWLPLSTDFATRNVARQATDPSSVWSTYRNLLRLRRSSSSLRKGSLRLIESGVPAVLAYLREDGGEQTLVVVNFSRATVCAEIRGLSTHRWAALVGTGEPVRDTVEPERFELRPVEALVLQPG